MNIEHPTPDDDRRLDDIERRLDSLDASLGGRPLGTNSSSALLAGAWTGWLVAILSLAAPWVQGSLPTMFAGVSEATRLTWLGLVVIAVALNIMARRPAPSRAFTVGLWSVFGGSLLTAIPTITSFGEPNRVNTDDAATAGGQWVALVGLTLVVAFTFAAFDDADSALRR